MPAAQVNRLLVFPDNQTKMPSWSQRVFLLLLFLLSFDAVSFVFGAPQTPQTPTRRQLSQRLANGETNAKRFASGLPPLPPVKRGSPTDSESFILILAAIY
jgi:hypothetical protein